MNLLRYFDLNYRLERVKKRQNWLKEAPPKHQGRKKASWFGSPKDDEPIEESPPMSLAEQLLMYVGVLLGVCFRSLIHDSDAKINFTFAAVIALAVVPIVFEKLRIKTEAPLLFRFGLFVQQGMFWDTILEVAGTNLGVR